MKTVKIIAFVLGGLVALVLAAGAYLVANFDANKWKGEITQLVQQKKQRTLKIEGDLSLSLFPSIAVTLGKTTLSEFKSEKPFASVAGARVSVRLMPLLSRQIEVDTVRLDGVKAQLVRDKSGRLNIDDLLSKDESEPPLHFDIAGIELTNGELGWRDEKAGQNITLSALSLTTGRLANAANDHFELSAQLAGKAPQLAAKLTAQGEYRYDLDKKSFGATRLDLRLNGDVAGVKALDLALAAAGVHLAAGGQVAIDQLAFSARGTQAGDAFEAKLDAPKLTLAADQASGANITAALKLKGAQRALDARLTLAGVEGKSPLLKIGQLAVELDARQGETALKGKLASPLTANLEKLTFDAPAIAGELDVTHPQMPMKHVMLPLKAGVRADLAAHSASVQADTRFDESHIVAKANLTRFAPLALNFDLDIDRLNVDKYLPPGPAPAAGKETGKGAEKGAEKPVDFSALKDLDASGVIRIGQLQVSNIKASNVRLDIRAANGRLEVAPLAANLYEGSLSGALSVNAGSHQVALKQTLNNVNINPLMKDALDKDALEGRGNVALDVTTAGTTVVAMKKALAGTASLKLRDGAIKGINLAKKFRETKALFGGRQDSVQQASQSEKTDFSELSASFRIARGVAHNEDLEMKSPFVRLGGAGDIDIGNEQIDYLAKASVVATAAGQGGKELEHLKGLTVPVRLTGPFDKLAYKIEFGALVGEAAKARVEEKVREKMEEKLLGKTGGKSGDGAGTQTTDKPGKKSGDILKKLFK